MSLADAKNEYEGTLQDEPVTSPGFVLSDRHQTLLTMPAVAKLFFDARGKLFGVIINVDHPFTNEPGSGLLRHLWLARARCMSG
jgi:hypothetical protein